MSKENRVVQFKQLYEAFQALNPRELETLPSAFSDFDGLNLEESKATLRFCIETTDALLKDEALRELSWHAFNALQSVLQNVYNQYAQFKSTRDQGSFQNFVQNLDSFAYHLRMFGTPFLLAGGAQIEKTTTVLNAELERLVAARIDVERLRDEVKALIAPAVAGSLSEAFTARRNTLLRGRIVWGSIALAVGAYCIHATYGFASAVGDAIVASSVVKQPQTNGDFVWLAVMIRSAILIPLYAAFGFSFSQYKKERDFEEEYAHKAAVATSLPNYGDLAREPAVRDQIVTGATNVIFTSPTAKKVDIEKNEKTLIGVKDIVDSIAKLMPKKD